MDGVKFNFDFCLLTLQKTYDAADTFFNMVYVNGTLLCFLLFSTFFKLLLHMHFFLALIVVSLMALPSF